jgi:alginate O-acetyltransferase complex protein AlgI
MLFTELRFFAFFLVAFVVHWALPRNGQRKWWLLGCSYLFYGLWDWRFLLLIFASTLIDYFVGLGLARAETPRSRKALLGISLAGNLGILGFFKYYDFFVTAAADFIGLLGFQAHLPTLELILPVGISFYTFQTLSYSIDVYRRQIPVERNLRDLALFVAFFPQLVAGPIVRAADLLPQFAARRVWSQVTVRSHLTLFLMGFVKKACISDNPAILSDRIFADPQAFTLVERWLGVGLYSLQAYCDFSGYSDMAIACAGLLGYELVINFNFPFFSVSVTDFWRRWHISLMTWLRDYVYIPLGGNRRSPLRTYVNLFLVFSLCGLWHGANWNYVTWGMFNGVFLMIERGANRAGHFDPEKPGLHRRAYTHLVWMIGLVLFRAGNMPDALFYIRGLFWPLETGASAAPVDPAWWILIPAFGLVHWVVYRRFLHARLAALPDWAFAGLYGATVAVVLPFVATDYQPFIYFQF